MADYSDFLFPSFCSLYCSRNMLFLYSGPFSCNDHYVRFNRGEERNQSQHLRHPDSLYLFFVHFLFTSGVFFFYLYGTKDGKRRESQSLCYIFCLKFKALPDAKGTYRLWAVLCSRAVVYLRLIYPFSRLWSFSPACGHPSGSFHGLLYRAIFAFESLHSLPSFGEKGKESNGCFTHELCPDAS